MPLNSTLKMTKMVNANVYFTTVTIFNVKNTPPNKSTNFTSVPIVNAGRCIRVSPVGSSRLAGRRGVIGTHSWKSARNAITGLGLQRCPQDPGLKSRLQWPPATPLCCSTPRERRSLMGGTSQSPRSPKSHGFPVTHTSLPEPTADIFAQQRTTRGLAE